MDENNPPAFPVKVKRNTSTDPFATPREIQLEGMTLRDWFAGQALSGLCANQRATHEWIGQYAASSAYSIADALLAARKGQGND
jgi:hypothetical protein